MGVKIVKILNNNLVYARERDGSYVIAMGRGIGFAGKAGQKLDRADVEKVIRMDSQQTIDRLVEQLEQIPAEFFALSHSIVEYATDKLETQLNQNVYITLTDHISFSLQRREKGLNFSNPLLWEIKKYYPAEFDVGLYAIRRIEQEYGVDLGEDEAAFIAMHVVCARYDSDMNEMMDTTKLVTKIIEMVQAYFDTKLDEESLAFQRFVTHLRFLAGRIMGGEQWGSIDGMDEEFVAMVRECYQKEFSCALEIGGYVRLEHGHEMSQMELTYLTVHMRNMRKGRVG